MAGVGHRAAVVLEQAFLPRVRALLRQVGVLHADETPGRAAGGLEYVHVASTEFLTAMHTGGRSKDDIDAGGILPGYTGTIVRDGYAGYTHLVTAHHAWCAAHYADLRIMPMSALNALVVAVPPGHEVGIIADSTGRSAGSRGRSWALQRVFGDATRDYIFLICGRRIVAGRWGS
jgi:hypothetical protein